MARKSNVDNRKEALRAFRRKQSADLNLYCKENGVCVRCKNPESKITTETLCDECAGYYKKYSLQQRQSKVPAKVTAPKKQVAKAPAKKAAPKKKGKK